MYWHNLVADFFQTGTGAVRKKESNVELDCNLSGQHNGSLVFELIVNYLLAIVKLDTIINNYSMSARWI